MLYDEFLCDFYREVLFEEIRFCDKAFSESLEFERTNFYLPKFDSSLVSNLIKPKIISREYFQFVPQQYSLETYKKIRKAERTENEIIGINRTN